MAAKCQFDLKKGGLRSTLPQNLYRPMSLTSTSSKLMEAIIKDYLHVASSRGDINKLQRDFITKHSTTTTNCFRVHI